MDYISRPWLAVVPWTQVRLSHGAIATVLPHWPLYQRRIMLPGRPPVVFEPAPMAMVDVCEPTDAECLATLALAFGQPEVLAKLDGLSGDWYRAPEMVASTVNRHLRDFHRTLDLGTTYHATRSVSESLAYHWQLHQQVLVHPLPIKHLHSREM